MSSAAAPPPDKEFMATLAKGLAVLGAFGSERPAMTLSEAAATAGLSRAAARRVLRTLAGLGYVTHDGRRFALAPRILELGFAYLSTQSWVDRAEPLMKELSHDVQESCSAAILQDAEVVYVARMPAPHRIMSVTLAVGTRLPAFYTALGRVQLGFLAPDELTRRLGLRGPPPTGRKAMRSSTRSWRGDCVRSRCRSSPARASTSAPSTCPDTPAASASAISAAISCQS